MGRGALAGLRRRWLVRPSSMPCLPRSPRRWCALRSGRRPRRRPGRRFHRGPQPGQQRLLKVVHRLLGPCGFGGVRRLPGAPAGARPTMPPRARCGSEHASRRQPPAHVIALPAHADPPGAVQAASSQFHAALRTFPGTAPILCTSRSASGVRYGLHPTIRVLCLALVVATALASGAMLRAGPVPPGHSTRTAAATPTR